jgi:hypothetical protein
MVTYTLTTPLTVGTLSSSQTITSLQLTTIAYTSTPALALIGTGVLQLILTDPTSGAQETINYQDASVLAFWAKTVSTTATEELGDIISSAVFEKLIADGKLPAGTLTTITFATSSTTSLTGTAITLTATVTPSTTTGTVTFYDGSTALGTAAVNGGVATLSISSLAVGAHSLSAALGASTSSAVSVTITENAAS